MMKRPNFKLLHTLLLVILILFSALAVFTFLNRPTIPNLEFKIMSGKQLSTQSLLGKVYLVNFWSPDCVPCIKEMPDLKKIYSEYKKQNFEIMAVAMDFNSLQSVKQTSENMALPFFVVHDNDGLIAKNFDNVSVTPTSFLVNKKGKIVKRYIGIPNMDDLKHLIEQSLKET